MSGSEEGVAENPLSNNIWFFHRKEHNNIWLNFLKFLILLQTNIYPIIKNKGSPMIITS